MNTKETMEKVKVIFMSVNINMIINNIIEILFLIIKILSTILVILKNKIDLRIKSLFLKNSINHGSFLSKNKEIYICIFRNI